MLLVCPSPYASPLITLEITKQLMFWLFKFLRINDRLHSEQSVTASINDAHQSRTVRSIGWIISLDSTRQTKSSTKLITRSYSKINSLMYGFCRWLDPRMYIALFLSRNTVFRSVPICQRMP